MHADLSGFELAPKNTSPTSGAQIGAGTRGGLTSPYLYAPHRARCYTTIPTFSWSQRGLSNDFRFLLYDSNKKIVFETAVHGKTLTYPTDATPLQPGRTYLWTVQSEGSLVEETPEPVELVLLPIQERETIEHSLHNFKGDSLSDQLRRASVFVDARVWYDATAIYSRLIAKYPNEADLYERRGEIYDQISQTRELADQDFARADNLRSVVSERK